MISSYLNHNNLEPRSFADLYNNHNSTVCKQLSTMTIAFLLAATAGYATATTFAQFCDDTACSVNCGISVSVDNPGCLNEAGRHSILFHGDNVQPVNLVFSPTPDCPCQNECVTPVKCAGATCGAVQQCLDLSGNMLAESFRFIGGGISNNHCDANNC